MARAPKKDKFHSEAPKEVYELLAEVIEKQHPDLEETEFLILYRHGGWKTKGKVVFGKVTILTDAYRRTMKKDAMLVLNADMWGIMSPAQKLYVLDHQMYSIDVATDKQGDTRTAADGRPTLASIPPDIEAFANVIKRHGIIMEDVKRLAGALKETNQMTIEEAAAEAQSEPPAEPREGIRGTIDHNGVVEPEDKNQLTLEQAAAAAGNEDPQDLESDEQSDPMANVKKEDW